MSPTPTEPTSTEPASTIRPTRLLVVGAAGGIGRWLGDHVLAALHWDHVTLLDTAAAVSALEHRYRAPVSVAQVVDPAHLVDASGTPVELGAPGTAVCLAVPGTMLPQVIGWLLPSLHPSTVVFDCSAERRTASELIHQARPDLARFGLHALFGTTAESADGQTFALCPSAEHPDAHRWLEQAIAEVGGTINVLTDERHDEIMRYVQAATHQALLTFAEVIGRSGLDLERDLWANRTPVFELMLALAGRTLVPGQETTTAAIQAAGGPHVGPMLAEAQAHLRQAVDGGDDAITAYLEGVRAPFSGGLFTKIQQAAVLATGAVQSTRAEVSRHARDGRLIGVRSLVNDDRLHVGTVVRTTPTSFVLRDQLVGKRGAAALLTDAEATANARKLGIAGSARNVEFSLGRVRILTPLELDAELEQWLATVARGTKLLIPESISGTSALRVVQGLPEVAEAELLSEEVRLGQREVVIRFRSRVDRHLADVERLVQARSDEVFVWPDGVVLPVLSHSPVRIGYLGPAGTFSDLAARQLARLVAGHVTVTGSVELPDFPTIARAVQDGEVALAVMPITNSSSGLVDLAAGVWMASPPVLTAGGVVDVPVRFDAYVAPGTTFAPGDPVFSHPQGFRQCSTFVAANRLVEHPCTSTADACREVALHGRGVALAATGLQDEFGVELARANVGNLSGALTRFLVLGREGMFGPPVRADATLRSVWVADGDRVDAAPSDAARYDEILRGPSGRVLVISTRPDRLVAGPGVRSIGTIPWSPRTPLVVVE